MHDVEHAHTLHYSQTVTAFKGGVLNEYKHISCSLCYAAIEVYCFSQNTEVPSNALFFPAYTFLWVISGH